MTDDLAPFVDRYANLSPEQLHVLTLEAQRHDMLAIRACCRAIELEDDGSEDYARQMMTLQLAAIRHALAGDTRAAIVRAARHTQLGGSSE